MGNRKKGKRIAAAGFVLVLAAAIIESAFPYLERAGAFASGISMVNPGDCLSEQMGLLIMGAGVIGLARLGRKIFLK